MIKTYYIEDSNDEILGYYKTLNEAKYSFSIIIKTIPFNVVRIVALRGQYFGEGSHFYYLYLNDSKKFKKVK